jgi:membrane protease YdiL (CAAX protease family)
MAAIYLIGLVAHLVLGGEMPPFTMVRGEFRLIRLYLFLVVLVPWNGPVGEEFGWRGFSLPRHQSSRGPLTASLIIGSVWGIWHLPTFFSPMGVLAAMTSALGVIFIVPYTATTIASSIFMTWLCNKTKKSALIAGIVWHAASNFWAPVLLSDSSLVAAREGTHLPTIAPGLYLSVTAVLVVAAGLLVIATKGELGLMAEA